ncbi:MAG: hypothetical protein IH951_11765 [Bacteroidetes bacterium]|nr:hypothetical protein [Bacteroidota bacterium]
MSKPRLLDVMIWIGWIFLAVVIVVPSCAKAGGYRSQSERTTEALERIADAMENQE